jgi:hypothetical protein
VRTPLKRRRLRPKLSRRQRAVNRAHAKIRARGERAIATLTWKILAKQRYCPRRAIAIVQAILVLHHVEANRYTGRKGLDAGRALDARLSRGPRRRLLKP